MYITALVDTFLKSKNIDSNQLAPFQKVLIPKGTKLAVTALPATGQSYQVELQGDLASLKLREKTTWFIYIPHWQFPKEFLGFKPKQPQPIKLKVPYYSQNDSGYEGGRQCFSHACAMMLEFLRPGVLTKPAKEQGYVQPENYYNNIRDRYGDTTDNAAQISALAHLGINAYFSQTISPSDLYQALALGIPIPIGVSYKADGHWVLVVGWENNNWLIHDPHGVRQGTLNQYAIYSTDQGREGAYDVWSQDVMDKLYWDLATDSNKESGWAIIPTKVISNPTGLPNYL